MKNLLVLLLLSVALSANAQDKKNNRPTSYNYMRGVESVQNEKTEEALEFFNKDIQENPKNGYSYSWIAMLRVHQEEYGRALTAADMAIKLLPKKDAEYVIFAYSTRADVYLNLEDTVKAISDLTTAIKIKPDENSLYEKRAQIYYEQERYDLADADYQKMIELKPGETMGYMGLGRNANAQKRWDDTIKQFDFVTKLASDYSQGYAFRAESYIGKEKWAEATDDIVKALSLDWDRKALYLDKKITLFYLSVLNIAKQYPFSIHQFSGCHEQRTLLQYLLIGPNQPIQNMIELNYLYHYTKVCFSTPLVESN